MSTAEKIFEKAQSLPKDAQDALLRMAELLTSNVNPASSASAPKPKFGSAKGQIKLAPDFDAPLEDFKPYME